MDCLRRLGGIEGGAGHSVNEQEGRLQGRSQNKASLFHGQNGFILKTTAIHAFLQKKNSANEHLSNLEL